MTAVELDVDRALIDLGLELLALDPQQVEAWYVDAPSDLRDAADAALKHPAVVRYAEGRRYVADPVAWIEARLRERLWSKQRAVAEAVRDHRQVAVPACHGVGKSYLAARLTAWWVESHPPGSAFVLTTAPTGDQVRGILWRELNRAHSRGGLAGRVNLSQWYVGNELVALGRKPSDTNPAALQGIHAEFVLVVIDEADGVSSNIFDAATDTLATTEASRVLAIGNPDRSSGSFFRAVEVDPDWHVVRISAFDAPAFTGEHVTDRVARNLVSRTWVEERRRKWGEGDPRWSAKVLGKAPPSNPDATIPYGQLRDAIDPDDDTGPPAVRHERTGKVLAWRWTDLPELPEWGIDVGAGGDRTVVWERRGRFLCRRWTVREEDSEVQAEAIEGLVALWGQPETIRIDRTGVGWGLAGALRKRARTAGNPLHGTTVDGIHFGAAGAAPSDTSPGFGTVRDELWWNGRELTIAGAWDLRTLRSPEHGEPELEDDVVSELTDPTWNAEGKGGRIKVEPKAKTASRLGRSPDDADAILLAFWRGTARKGRLPSRAVLGTVAR